MINLLLGGPGAGKSYEAVVFHVLAAVMRGRLVITNLPLNIDSFAAIDPSFPGLLEIREKTLGTKPEEGTGPALRRGPEWSARAFANPEDFASEWRHPEGYGPLYVVDECHFCMPVGRTSIAVEEWMSMHRHYNADVLLITQSSSKISRAIRDLVQVCYKVRKAVALGKPDGYIRKVLDGVNGGEVSVTERKYKAQYFGLYRSHTQGMALQEQKADDVAPKLVAFKRFSRVFYALTAVACVWAFWPAHAKPKPVRDTGTADTSRYAKPAQQAPQGVTAGVGQQQAVKTPQNDDTGEVEVGPDEVPEPLASKMVHLTGRLAMAGRTLYTFAISASGHRIGAITSVELADMGYRWEPLTDCAGTLRWKAKARAVTCDAPEIGQGSEARPVVLALPAGSSTPVASSRTPG